MKNKWVVTVSLVLYLVTGITAFGEEADETDAIYAKKAGKKAVRTN